MHVLLALAGMFPSLMHMIRECKFILPYKVRHDIGPMSTAPSFVNTAVLLVDYMMACIHHVCLPSATESHIPVHTLFALQT